MGIISGGALSTYASPPPERPPYMNDVDIFLFQVIQPRKEAEAVMAVKIAEVEREYQQRQEVGHCSRGGGGLGDDNTRA